MSGSGSWFLFPAAGLVLCVVKIQSPFLLVRLIFNYFAYVLFDNGCCHTYIIGPQNDISISGSQRSINADLLTKSQKKKH